MVTETGGGRGGPEEEEEEEEEEHWLQSAKTANATTKAFCRTLFRCVIVYYPLHNTPLGDLLQVS